MYVEKINDDLVLLEDRNRFSFYEYTAGELKKSSVFFQKKDIIRMSDFTVYITSFREAVYVYWRDCSLVIHKFMRIISKSEYKAYFEDETGDIWILSVFPLAEGDLKEVGLKMTKKGAS